MNQRKKLFMLLWFINVQDKTIHKRQAYKCSVCHKWHLGRGKTLTDEDKRKLKIKHNIR